MAPLARSSLLVEPAFHVLKEGYIATAIRRAAVAPGIAKSQKKLAEGSYEHDMRPSASRTPVPGSGITDAIQPL